MWRPVRSGCDVRPGCDVRMWRPARMSGFSDRKSKDAQRNFTQNPFLKSPISLFWGRFVTKQFWGHFKEFYAFCTKHLQIVLCKYKAYTYKMCPSRFLWFLLRSPAAMSNSPNVGAGLRKQNHRNHDGHIWYVFASYLHISHYHDSAYSAYVGPAEISYSPTTTMCHCVIYQ